jgi:carboxypeptidase family protein
VASATRGGLSGVVGDTAFNIIEGATIWALASDRRAMSDSAGQFFLDLKPGRHMVRVERPGYGSKLVSVNIPRDSGRRVTVWLSPATTFERRESQALLEMSMRLTRRNPVWSKIYTREDFLKTNMQTTDRFASAGAGKRIPEYCEAIVDGYVREPLWIIDLADVETMEVYTSRPPRGGARNPNAGGPSQSGLRGVPQPRECEGTRVYVWLRK